MDEYQQGMVNGIMLTMSAVAIMLEKRGYSTEEIKAMLNDVKNEMDNQRENK